MADNARIEDLRRRVQKDPASIAFAQLAEEHRRAGHHEEAIRVCRAGLEHHPAYLSARVTLGRSLLDLGRLDDARKELSLVLTSAPDNVAAKAALELIRKVGLEQAVEPSSGALSSSTGEQKDPALRELEVWLDVVTERRSAGPR